MMLQKHGISFNNLLTHPMYYVPCKKYNEVPIFLLVKSQKSDEFFIKYRDSVNWKTMII